MKRALAAALFVSLVGATSAQQMPDVTGTWVATTDTPATFSAAPSPETKTSVPGATCFGDSAVFETAAVDGDALVLTTTGTLAAGASARVNANARRLVRRLSPDTILVEGLTSAGGQRRQVATVYRKSTDVMTASARPVPSTTASIGAVSWIGGTWSTVGLPTSSISTVTEERWTPPEGGAMLAVARAVRGTTMSSFEFLCIVERAGGLVYTAMPNGRTPATDFMMTSFTEKSATFENPAHDYPKKIRYSLTPEGLLQTEVSGAAGSRVTTVILKKQ